MLWASPPDDGADADGRFDVDSVLVTEFLLSFVGTLAGLKLSSDIAACIQRARRFRAFRPGRSQRGYLSVTDAPQRVIAARRPVLLLVTQTGQDPLQPGPKLVSQPVCGKPGSWLSTPKQC